MKTASQYEIWERALSEMSPELHAEIESARRVDIVFRECGKVKYGHEDTAKSAAQAMHEKTGDQYDAYQCAWCEDAWHIGHPRRVE